ncbi:MAG: hypothetical protein AB7U52_04620 [Candidatus Izemoplasmatales bacterium]
MKNYLKIIRNDFINFNKYRILHMTVIVSLVFALAMGFFPTIEPLLFVYISIFVLPIIIHSITLFIENEENAVLPYSLTKNKLHEIILAKISSSLLMQLIPLVFYLIVIVFVLNVNFSILLFILTYVVGVTLHIIIGFSITILAKNYQAMVIMYVGYIILFSFVAFINLMNLIPDSISYLFIFSPGYLVSVLFSNITFGYLYSSLLLIILSASLLLIYTGLLLFLLVKPYYKKLLNEK